MIESNIQHIARLIREAKHAVALTGAGVSTPSGIPDFRSADSGMWTSMDPMQVASIFGFKQQPETFYNWMRPLAQTILEAQPNAAHIALAQLEQNGYIKSLITQNIDMLHTKAGSKQVYEVHGHLREATCIECFRVFDVELVMKQFLENGEVPRCTCPRQQVLKPNVILVGEQLPVRTLYAAQKAARDCDVMLVAGSSLEVVPAGDLPRLAKQNGAQIIIVNYGITPADEFADVVLHKDVAEVLPQIATAVIERT